MDGTFYIYIVGLPSFLKSTFIIWGGRCFSLLSFENPKQSAAHSIEFISKAHTWISMIGWHELELGYKSIFKLNLINVKF
jgi:hypothetical protein